MLLLRSLLRCKKLLAELVRGGLPAPCKTFLALEPVDGVEGGRLAEYGVAGPPGVAETGKPALVMVLGVFMLRPPHLGHLRFSESSEFVEGLEPDERLLFLPFRRG